MRVAFSYVSVLLLASTIGTPTRSMELLEPSAKIYERDCSVSGFTNTEAKWRIELVRGPAKEIVVVLEGEGLDRQPLDVVEGQARFIGTSFVSLVSTVTLNGAPIDSRFQSVGGTISNAEGEPSVIMSVIGGEDGSDNDWQDMVLTLTCVISEL